MLWRTQVALTCRVGTAHREWDLQPSWPVGGWAAVSLPLFQFLLLRWYFRLFIWARFLWQVSRIELKDHANPSGPLRRTGLSRG